MDKTFKIIQLMIAAGAVIVTIIYFTSPRALPAVVTTLSDVEIVKVDESTEKDTTTKAEEIIENNFCREFHSTGAITKTVRNQKPGLLKEADQVVFAKDSVFFLETSCAADLQPRQSCSVESAARANPGKQIYVLFISPDASIGPDGGKNIRKLKSIYANIHFYYIDIINYTKGTKMEKWVVNQNLKMSSYKVAHLSDGLRLLTLCKYGGIYFDLDVVVMHSLQNMSNFAGDESKDTICNAVISMKANGTLVNACLDEFVNDYRGDLWSYNGPNAIQRALDKTCERKTRRLWKNCDGTFVIYPTSEFYPIPWQNWKVYFEENNDERIAQLINNSVAVHVWNKMSEKGKIKVGSHILYGDIASKYCPLSYWNSGQSF